MKFTLPRALKKALLATLLTSSLLTPCLSAATVTDTNATLTVSGTGEATLPAWSSGDSIVFDNTTDATTVVNYGGNLEGMSNLTVNSDGVTLQAAADNTGFRFVTPASGGINMTINGNFTFDLTGGSTNNQFNRNFSLSAARANIEIATGKTFNLIGDLVGDDNAVLNLTGGGTFNYLRNDVADSSSSNQHAGNVAINISGGTTMDVSQNDASTMDILLLGGTISLDAGNLTLMTGDVTLSNALSLTGANNITGATSLTFGDTISFDAGASLNLDATTVDLSSLTLDLAALDAGDSISFSGSALSGLTAGAATSGLTGLSNTESAAWSFADDTWTLSISGYTPQDLVWNGTDGQLAVGVGGWNVGGTDATFADNDNITLAGASSSITVEGAITVSSITVSGDNDYTLTTDDTTPDSLSNAGVLTKNGAGTLTLDGDLALTGNKQINSGTLHIASANALGEGQLQFSGGTTLSVAGGLGDVTVAGSGYVRNTPNLTVSVGAGTTFTENVQLRVGAGETIIDGGGTYQIQKLLLNQPNTSTPSTLTIAADTTLVIQDTTLSTAGGTGAFMVGHYSGVTNTVNIHGTLTSAAGISTNNGTGIVNVKDGGTLNLQQGLAVAALNTAPTVNVESGATLRLWNKGSGSSANKALTVNIQSGSTLASGGTNAVTISDSLSYAENASVTFDATAANLVLDHVVDLGTGTATLQGAAIGRSVTFAQDASMGALVSDNGFILQTGATLSVTTSLDLADWNITAADAAAPITIEARGTDNATFNNTQAANALITNATLSKNVWISDSMLKDSLVTTGTNLTLIGNVTLDNTQFATGASAVAMGLSSLTINNADASTLTALATLDTTAVDLTLEGSHAVTHTPEPSASTSLTEINTMESTTEMMHLYTLDLGVGDYQSITLDEGLVLTLTMTQDEFDIFNDQYATDGVAFSFTDDVTLGGWYNTIAIAVNVEGTEAWRQNLLGVGTADGVDGSVYYIPEPSTATLSLLALTGLLARRRRKSA